MDSGAALSRMHREKPSPGQYLLFLMLASDPLLLCHIGKLFFLIAALTLASGYASFADLEQTHFSSFISVNSLCTSQVLACHLLVSVSFSDTPTCSTAAWRKRKMCM